MEFLIVFGVAFLLIFSVLMSINQKLSMLIQNKAMPQAEDENIVEIRECVAEIKSILEDIKYTTDIIENYKLPTHSERKAIDQYRVDQEIDDMLNQKRV